MVFIHHRSSENTPITANQSSSAQNIIPKPNVSTCMTESQQVNKVVNIIKNHDFSEGLKGWQVTSKGESGYVVPKEGNYLVDVLPYLGINYAVVTHRLKTHQGLEQDITGKLKDNVEYTISALVRVYGMSLGADGKAKVEATLRLEYPNEDDEYPELVSARVSADEWTKLESTFILRNLKVRHDTPKGVVFYLEGPDEGVDLLINSVVISPSVV